MADYLVSRDAWSKLSLFEQMGNIYSEVGRSISAKRRGDDEMRDEAFWRASDLFDATIEALVEQKSPRSKEVLRSREQYVEALYFGDETKEVAIDKYFFEFAIASRINKG